MKFEDKKVLVAFFSRAGFNYVSGGIENIPIGNTEIVAKLLAEKVKGDLFKIETEKSYPISYNEATEVAKEELTKNARPKLTTHVKNFEEYDIIFLGFPNWWSTMPMAVHTFLEEYDFTGKTIIPFCTHEGSGMGRSEKDIAKLCPKANILKGLPIYGSSAKRSGNDLNNWINNI